MAATLLLGACSGPADRGVMFSSRDSSGVLILEHDLREPSSIPEWKLDPTPMLSVGGPGDTHPLELLRVKSVDRLPSGEIVLANGGTQQVLVFSPAGALLKSIGGSGACPCEFSSLVFAQVRDDSILSYDLIQRRLSVFDRAGTLSRSSPTGTGYVRYVSNDGSFFATSPQIPPLQPGIIRPTVLLLHVSTSPPAVDTIGQFPDTEIIFDPGYNYVGEQRPFGRKFTTAFDDSLIYVGTEDTYSIARMTQKGRVLSYIRGVTNPVRVGQREFDSYMAPLLNATGEGPRKEFLKRLAQSRPIPETMPAHGPIRAGYAGELWVEDYRPPYDSVTSWKVFESSGKLVAQVRLSKPFSLMGVGRDWIAGIWRDDSETEHLHIYRLTR